MPVSEARVTTPEASRYLQQLCKHWSHKFSVDFTPAHGRVPFDDDRACVFDANADLLTMRIEASTEEALLRTQGTVENHLKRFAFKENLDGIEWRRLG